MQIINFIKQNWMYILVIVLVVVSFSTLLITEGFAQLAEYPKVFSDNLVGLESTIFRPNMPHINHLDIESQIQTVMIDIGNGNTVEAPVHIPAQTIENIQEQTVIKYVEPRETDVIVSAQVVQMPEQEGTIKAKVNNNGDYIQVPVVVPAQTVTIPEQKALQTSAEKFHLM